MITILKRSTGAHGNELEFYRTSQMKDTQIMVRDNHCLKERCYTIGKTQELDNWEEVKIKSFEQVIKSWENGKIWF